MEFATMHGGVIWVSAGEARGIMEQQGASAA